MTPEVFVELQNQINTINQSLSDIKKTVNLLKLHDQSYVESNSKIPPAVATKVAYDEKGLIVSSSQLESSDIPDISIDQVTNLRETLSSVPSITQVNKMIDDIDIPRKSDSATATACKVNYDSNGYVVSGSSLTLDDIPNIPMSKIIGLDDAIQSIVPQNIENESVVTKAKVTSGTFTKVTINSDGSILSGNTLLMSDLPMDLINRLNHIESKLPLFVTRETFDSMSKEASKISNLSIPNAKPGTYAKVTINSNGMVTKGDNLSISDLPEISTSDITNLDSALRNKADQSDLIKLNESINSIISMTSEITDMNTMKSQIETKASKSDLAMLSNKIDTLQKNMDTMFKLATLDSLVLQIESLQSDIDTISGKVSAIEHKLAMKESFD